MTTTGTFAFNPSLGELVINAYARVGIMRGDILQSHMQDARMEANLLQAEWNNKQVNLWTVELLATPLVASTDTYTLSSAIVMILDAYVSVGTSPVIDSIILPISRTEYASIPNKLQESKPTQYWFNRIETPTITLWPVPDSNGPYTLNIYTCKLIEDADLANAATLQITQLWMDAFASGLAFRLARIYAPQLRDMLKMDYTEAWNVAATQDVENVPLCIVPGLAGYYT